MITKRSPTLVSQPVGTSPSSLHHSPFATEKPALLKAMQSWIDRSLRKVEFVIAAVTQLIDDDVSVLCTVRNDGQ